MPLWALLALGGGGMGLLSSAEKRRQAETKRSIDLAQERVSGFTGQHPGFTAMPSTMKDVLSGAFSGASFGLANKDALMGGDKSTAATTSEVSNSSPTMKGGGGEEGMSALDAASASGESPLEIPIEGGAGGVKNVLMPFAGMPSQGQTSLYGKPRSSWAQLMMRG